MKHFMRDKALIVLLISLLQPNDAEPLVQVIPHGIESVDGSDVNMGCTSCTSPLVDSDGVMVCMSQSYLVDGCSPAIDTSTSDWASQLVTVRKTQTDGVSFDHVLLTFGFDTAVTPTGIELDLFLCPDMNIDAPYITVYGDEESNLVITYDSLASLPFQHYDPSQSSCDSLSTVNITLGDVFNDLFLTWHILISSFTSSIDWVYVGEVRFLGVDDSPQMTCTTPSVINVTSQVNTESCNTPTPSSNTIEIPSVPSNTTGIPSVPSSTTGIPSVPSSTTGIPSVPSNTTGIPSVPSNTIEIPSVPSNTTGIPSVPSTTTDSYITSSLDQMSDSPTTIDSNSTDLANTIPKGVWISTAIAVVVFILLLATVFVLCFIMIKIKSRVKEKSVEEKDYELRDIAKEDNHPPNSTDSDPSSHVLDLNNPTYPHHANKTDAPVGIYSEVGTDSKNTPKITITTGIEFTGMYNVVTPIITATDNESETIESAAYAVIKSKDELISNKKEVGNDDDDKAYAVPNELDYNKKKVFPKPVHLRELIDGGGKQVQAAPEVLLGEVEDPMEAGYSTVWSVQMYNNNKKAACVPPEVESEEKDEGPAERLRAYTGVQIREAPAVPSKSSDLELYLDTQSAFNVGIYNESINPLDFTRDRMKDGKDYHEFLAPVCISPSVLSETEQEPTEVTSTNITEKMKLGTGQFGEVVLADTNGLSLKTMKLSKTDDNQNISIVVAVKKMKPNPSQPQQDAFTNEAKFMSQLRHPNVLRLLGVCHQDPAFIMMEYTEEGDLNQFLQKYSEIVTTPSSEDQISASELVYIASQIASGMQYLAKLNFIHRDLATRSCFVGRINSIKVGSLGVNTSLYQFNYYRIRGNRLLPIRWMASECFNGKFSERSDVWAFGVTMWELFTLGKEAPYPHLSDEEVIHNALKQEYRQFPSKPAACPDDVYDMITEECWAVNMKKRATFQKLCKMLQM